MYHSHFSAISPLFSFWESLLKRSLVEGEKHEKRQHNQVPWVWKHKELERWKTQSSIWRNSEVLLQRMRAQVFIFGLIPKSFSFLSVAFRRFLVEAEGN